MKLLILSILTGLAIGWAAKQVKNAREAFGQPETVIVTHQPPKRIYGHPGALQRPSVHLRPVRPDLSLPAAAHEVEKSGDSIKFEF